MFLRYLWTSVLFQFQKYATDAPFDHTRKYFFFLFFAPISNYIGACKVKFEFTGDSRCIEESFQFVIKIRIGLPIKQERLKFGRYTCNLASDIPLHYLLLWESRCFLKMEREV